MKVKRLSRTATLPQKAHAGDLGYDLFCDEATAIFPAETRVVKIAGVIDNGYIGEICIALYNGTESLINLTPGEKIAQLVLIPTVNFSVEEVTEVISSDQRGAGGFGSTGV